MQRRASSSNGARIASVGHAAMPRATAAAIFFRRIRFDLDGRDDFAQENPVAELPADEVRVLADEAEAGPLRQIAFEQRAGVDVPKRTRRFAAKMRYEFAQRLE